MNDPARGVYNATLVGREDFHSHLRIFRVRPDGDLFPFEAGQYAVLGLLGREPRVPEADPEDPAPPADTLIRRAYSVASSSLERGHAEFFVNLVASGTLTPRLLALPHGGRIWLSAKATGMFTLNRVAPDKAVVLVATGTGLAPYVSMLRTILVRETTRRFVVLHGARYSWDLGYRGELESLSRLRPNLVYIPSITRPERDPHFVGLTGRVQSLLADGVVERQADVPLDPSKAEVFLCGNPDMIVEAKGLLVERGYVQDKGREPGTLHVEEYW
jgi:ferredoxin--NADP+ reductase